MPTSILFKHEHGAVELSDATNYVVLNCLQWKSPHLGANLEPLPQAAEQKFCVMFEHLVDDRLVMMLERAYVQGMMSSVKLVVQHLDDLYLFSTTERHWTPWPLLKAGGRTVVS